MATNYANTSIYNVERKIVIQYLLDSQRIAFVSPDVNNFTVVYDKEIHPSSIIDFERSFITQLSKDLSCTVMGTYIAADFGFGYKIYHEGRLIDCYVARDAEDRSSDNYKRSQIIASIFNYENNVDRICSVLTKRLGRTEDTLINYLEKYDEIGIDFLIESEFLPSDRLRHEALTTLIGLDPWWSVNIDYNNIIYGDIECHFDEYGLDASDAFSKLESINISNY